MEFCNVGQMSSANWVLRTPLTRYFFPTTGPWLTLWEKEMSNLVENLQVRMVEAFFFTDDQWLHIIISDRLYEFTLNCLKKACIRLKVGTLKSVGDGNPNFGALSQFGILYYLIYNKTNGHMTLSQTCKRLRHRSDCKRPDQRAGRCLCSRIPRGWLAGSFQAACWRLGRSNAESWSFVATLDCGMCIRFLGLRGKLNPNGDLRGKEWKRSQILGFSLFCQEDVSVDPLEGSISGPQIRPYKH